MGAINSAGKRCGGDSVTRLTFELRVLKNEEKVTSSSGCGEEHSGRGNGLKQCVR